MPHINAQNLLPIELAREVAQFFQTLADPTRVRLLKALSDGEWSVMDLTRALQMEQPAVSHQLKYLRNLGLVHWKKEGRHVYYQLEDEYLKTLLVNIIQHLDEPPKER